MKLFRINQIMTPIKTYMMIRQKKSLWINKNAFINLTRKTLGSAFLRCSLSPNIFRKISCLTSWVVVMFNIMTFTTCKSQQKITKDLELKEAIPIPELMQRLRSYTETWHTLILTKYSKVKETSLRNNMVKHWQSI